MLWFGGRRVRHERADLLHLHATAARADKKGVDDTAEELRKETPG